MLARNLMGRISSALTQKRLPFTTEVELQDAVEQALRDAGISFLREHRRDGMNRFDFVVSGVVIEVKVSGSARNTYRQVKRYCLLPEVLGVVVVTGKTIGMPEVVEGKPVAVHSVGKAWL